MKKEFYFLKIAQFFFSISGGIASGICAEGYGVNILEIIICNYVFLQYYLYINIFFHIRFVAYLILVVGGNLPKI